MQNKKLLSLVLITIAISNSINNHLGNNYAREHGPKVFANSHNRSSNLGYYIERISNYTDLDHEVMPGAVVLILIPVQSGSTLLKNSKLVFGSETKSEMYSVPILRYDSRTYYALLPISYDINKGEYHAKLEYDAKQLKLTKLKNIPQNTSFKLDVGYREFFKEDVILNYRLAKRKSEPASPKVVQEAEEIWDTTGKVNEGSIYEIANFEFPIEKYKYITGMFADQRIYTYSDGKKISSTKHGGIDIASSIGTPVFSAGTGKVVLAKERIVTGKSVVVEHFPGVYTMYYHLSKIQVTKDQIVLKASQVGELGNSGFSTGPHLHWEMRVNNIRVDPLYLLGQLDNIKTLILKYK